jgi:hypothetical protein
MIALSLASATLHRPCFCRAGLEPYFEQPNETKVQIGDGEASQEVEKQSSC